MKKKMAFLMSKEKVSSVSPAWADLGLEHRSGIQYLLQERKVNCIWEWHGFLSFSHTTVQGVEKDGW